MIFLLFLTSNLSFMNSLSYNRIIPLTLHSCNETIIIYLKGFSSLTPLCARALRLFINCWAISYGFHQFQLATYFKLNYIIYLICRFSINVYGFFFRLLVWWVLSCSNILLCMGWTVECTFSLKLGTRLQW